MVLCGFQSSYDSTLEGYVGANWSINVAKQALGIGLNKGLEGDFNGIKAVTREEACLYAFRTIQADLVEYGQRLTTTVNGTEVVLSSGGAESRKWNSQQTRVNNIREDDIVQFAEEYFRKLEKKRDTDKFERPAYTWIYDKEEIGTFVDWDLMVAEYTKAVSGRDLYDLLGGSTVNNIGTASGNIRFAYYVDGHAITGTTHPHGETDDILKADIARSNQEDAGISANGVLTQVFLDKDHGELTITSINTWLAQVTTEYSKDREYARMDVWNDMVAPGTAINYDVDVELVPSVVDVAEDDFYLVNISYKDDTTKGEVAIIAEPDIMEESVVTKFSRSGSVIAKNVTTGGTEYKNDRNAFYDLAAGDVLETYNDSRLTDRTYDIYMDAYGYFIGIALHEGIKNYVFITGFDRPTSNLSVKTADAAAIFLDGTMQEIKVNVTDTDKNIDNVNKLNASYETVNRADGANYFIPWATASLSSVGKGFYALNRWFTYSVNTAGVYTLKPATRMTIYATSTPNEVIKTANLYLDDNVMDNTRTSTDGVIGVPSPYLAWADQSRIQGHTLPASGSLSSPAYLYHRNNDTRVYGNDNTVYLTVDMDIVDNTAGAKQAITDVNGVYTGIQNVEIEIDNTAAIQEGHVYSVYDRNHYIIASVAVGEGNGGNAVIAYITDGAQSERIEDGVYYWEFKAIVDGEEKTLTLKDNYANTFKASGATLTGEDNSIHKAVFNHLHDPINYPFVSGASSSDDWNAQDGIVELRFDANGEYVTSVKPVDEDDIYSFYGDKAAGLTGGDSSEWAGGTRRMDKFKAYRIGGINDLMTAGAATWNGATNHYDSSPNSLTLAGRTLYVTDDQHDEGLALATDAKAVTIQVENGKWKTRMHNSVAAAVSHLAPTAGYNSVKDSWRGEIVAAIGSGGVAKWVVFTSYEELKSGNTSNPGGGLVGIDARTNVTYGWSATSKDITYELTGAVAGARYKVVLEQMNENGLWAEIDSWTETGIGGANVYTSPWVGTYSSNRTYRLTCGGYASMIAQKP